MKLDDYEKAKSQLKKKAANITIELLASQIGIADEARKRIEEEGIVIRDLKGSVIKHPAIEIEQKALKMIQEIIKDNNMT